MCSTHRGKSEGVPFEEGHRGDIDKHVLPSVSKETFAPHLNLDGLGRVLHDLDNDHFTQTTHKTHDSLDGVDDESTQQVDPRLQTNITHTHIMRYFGRAPDAHTCIHICILIIG